MYCNTHKCCISHTYWIMCNTTCMVSNIVQIHTWINYECFLLSCRLSSVDISHIQGNLEEISTFQQVLVQSLEEHTRSVSLCLSAPDGVLNWITSWCHISNWQFSAESGNYVKSMVNGRAHRSDQLVKNNQQEIKLTTILFTDYFSLSSDSKFEIFGFWIRQMSL